MAALGETNREDATAHIQEYYRTAAGDQVQQSFKSLDDPLVSDSSVVATQSRQTTNFVLDFSDDAAYVAFDLYPLSVAGLLDHERPDLLNTRWINVWAPAQQAPLLELLAQHYDFSPRLLALMSSRPRQQSQSSERRADNSHQWLRRRQVQVSSAKPDVEKGLDELSELSELSSVSSYDSAATSNLYKVVHELWHYSSVDFGRNYVCIGYNSLYGTKCAGEEPGDGLLPHCTRVWTWLILCEDDTIISINEDPFPFSGFRLDPNQQHILSETRRNIINIFRSISSNEGGSAMAQLPIRSRLGTTVAVTSHRPTDVPGLLFYYLFENWANSYTLITRRSSRYTLELQSLRDEMFTTPKLHHIDRLDSIGKELGILKRHYAAYNRIIDRLLEPQTATSASLQNTRANTEASQSSSPPSAPSRRRRKAPSASPSPLPRASASNASAT